MDYPLKPNLIILKTYLPEQKQFIRDGIVVSVGVFTTSAYDDYEQQLPYALQNSDGVMVFDYEGLLKRGY